MSARCPGPKTTAAGMSAVAYCQPSCRKHVVKMEIFFSWLLLEYFKTQSCVHVCLAMSLKSQEYPADGSLIKYVVIGFYMGL